MEDVAAAIQALRAWKPVILPTDTVYGLCASPYREEPVSRLYRLKGRNESMPTALLAPSVEMLFECVPELRGRAGVIARSLLPGPYTLILPNPGRRYRWLTGNNSLTIGVRVPVLPAPAARVVEMVGAVAATSANLPGEPAPSRVDDIPEQLLEGVAAVIDVGELPGVASTVIDCTGAEPRIVREGPEPADEIIERLRAVRT